MYKKTLCVFLVTLIFGILLGIPVQSNPVQAVHVLRYAAPTSSGTGDCSSWENACTLQTALTSASVATQIWVKSGVHYPTTVPSTDRTATFSLKNNVVILGGFAGTETNVADRDWRTNLTILSGDIDLNDNNADLNGIAETYEDIQGDNVFHVVTGIDITGTAALDGLVITAGLAFSTSPPDYFGAGMYNYMSSPVLSNLIITGNYANSGGGGIYNTINSNPAIFNTIFVGNRSNRGGGIDNDFSFPTLTNVIFSHNTANKGGAMGGWASDPVLLNVTITGNTGVTGVGGIYNSNCNPKLSNVILWGNTSPLAMEIDNVGTSTPDISYSNVQYCGGTAAWNLACGPLDLGNIDTDPLFVDSDTGDLHLQFNSPCIDAGDNLAVPMEIATDLDGNPRIADIPTIPDTGFYLTPPVVDMGAYEAQVPPVPGGFNKISPLDGAVDISTSPTLSWSSSSDATLYKYCIDTSDDDSCTPWVENGNATSIALSGLEADTTYYWQIWAINYSGVSYGDGSGNAYWSFTTAAPPEHTLYLPVLCK